MKKRNNFEEEALFAINKCDSAGLSAENSFLGLMQRMGLKGEDFHKLRKTLRKLEDGGYIEERHFTDPFRLY